LAENKKMISENEQRRLILKFCYEFKTVLLSCFCVCITVAMIQLQYMDFRVFMTSRFKLVEIMSVSTIALASRPDLIEIDTRILVSFNCWFKIIARVSIKAGRFCRTIRSSRSFYSL